MGLRCLIGHDYGEPKTARDRHQRGNEVVVTVREYRECTRCGRRRIVSESKEVKAEPSTDSPTEPSSEASGSARGEEGAAGGFAPSSDLPDPPLTAAEDDGIILEDEPDQSPRAYGEWPDADRETDEEFTHEHEPWPDQADGSASAPSAGEPDQPDVGPETSAGESAPSADPDDEEAAGLSASDADEPAAERTEPPRFRTSDRDTELVCPECGETWPGVNASLRPGDICPACRQGYLDEQVVH